MHHSYIAARGYKSREKLYSQYPYCTITPYFLSRIEHIFHPTIDKPSYYRVCNERDEKLSQREGEEV